jgi:clan AA aspartic protease (TIGR02281 family)
MSQLLKHARLVVLIWLIMLLSYASAEEVRLVKENGVYHLPVKINDAIELKFVVDTGASDVHIPADVALTLKRTGTISENDFIGKASYQLADGSIKENVKIKLRSLKIGNKVIRNVEAIVGSAKSQLLLGQSALEKLELWRMETRNGIFVYGDTVEKNVGHERKIPGEIVEIPWENWSKWDRATKSYVPVDGATESSKEVEMALVTLNPSMPPFLFVFRTASGWCGSGGCSLEVFKPSAGNRNYEPFDQWQTDNVRVRKDKTENGWYSLLIGENVWIYENGKYVLP